MLRDTSTFDGYSSDAEQVLLNGPFAGEDPGHPDIHADVLDDVFGSEPSSPTLAAQHEHSQPQNNSAHPSDIPRLRSLHVTNGYREGIAASKEQHIQAGFDEGFSLGGELGMRVGVCLGAFEGIVLALTSGKRKADTQAGDHALSEQMRTVFEQAQQELKMEELLSEKYFGPDGIWRYDVPGHDESEDASQMTFGDVAAAHPNLQKWRSELKKVSNDLGLMLQLGDEEAPSEQGSEALRP